MGNLVKRFILFLSIITISISIGVTANSELRKVIDDAGIFGNNDISTLESEIKALSEKYMMDIVITTTNDTNGKSARAYADDYFDYNGYGYGNEKNGILLLIDMDNREIYISTSGSGIKYFTDTRIDNILDNIYNEVSNKQYFNGAKVFVNNVSIYLEKGIPVNQYTVDEDLIERVLYSIALSFIAAVTVVQIVLKKYKKPASFHETTYVDNNSIKFIRRSDRFVSTHTSRRKIPKNNDSGGRSTSHSSSSGRSHGGGGRSF